MEYGSSPYVGMAPKKNGRRIKCVPNGRFKSLLHMAFMSHTCHSRVFSSAIRLLALLESTAEAPHRQVAKRANCPFLIVCSSSSFSQATVIFTEAITMIQMQRSGTSSGPLH